MTEPTRESEIRKIHKKAAEGQTQLSADEITEKLKDVDAQYQAATEQAYDAYDVDNDFEKFNESMAKAVLDLLKGTEEAVGKNISRNIHGKTYSQAKSTLKNSMKRGSKPYWIF